MFGRKKGITKLKASSDDSELDFDDGLDFDDYSTTSPEANKKSRSPIFSASVDVARGAGSGVLANKKSILGKFTKTVLPREYADLHDNATEAAWGIRNVYQDSFKGLNETKRQAQKVIRRAKPIVDKANIKLLSNLFNKLGGTPEEGYNQESLEEQRNKDISNTLSELFTNNIKAQAKKQKENQEIEEKKEAVTQVRFENQMGVLSSIETTLRKQFLFTNKNTFNYYRKSIELSLKKYYLLADIHQEQLKANKLTIQALNDIKYNTALPDFVKMKNKEILTEVAKRNLSNKITTLFSQGSFLNNFFKILADNVKYKIGGFSDMANMALDGADMMLDAHEMEAEMDEMMVEMGERRKSGIEKISGIAGGMASNTLAGWLGKKLRKPIMNSKLGRKLAEKRAQVNNFNENLGENALSAVRNRDNIINKVKNEKLRNILSKVSNSELGENTFGGLESIIRAAMSANTVKLDTIGNYSELSGISGADSLRNKVTTKVIPGYLARILQQLVMLRTGKSADLLEYSYTKNDFIVSREHTSQIVNDVLGSSFTNTFSNSKEGVFRKLDSNINIRNTFTNEDKNTVLNILLKAAINNVPIDNKFLSNVDNFKEIGNEKAKLLVEEFNKLIDEDTKDEYATNVSDIAYSVKSLKNNFGIDNNALQGVIDAGYGSHLLKSGLIDKDGKVNIKGYINLLQNGVEESKDISKAFNVDEVLSSNKTPWYKKDIKEFLPSKKPSISTTVNGENKLVENKQIVELIHKVSQESNTANPEYLTKLSSIDSTLLAQNEILTAILGRMDNIVINQYKINLEEIAAKLGNQGSSWFNRARMLTREGLSNLLSAGAKTSKFLWNNSISKFMRQSMLGMVKLPFKLAWDGIQSFKNNKDTFGKRAKELMDDSKYKMLDIYNKKYKDPIIKAKDFALGHYRDSKGKVISKLDDIQGDVYDADGNLIAKWDDIRDGYVIDKGKYLAVKGLNWFKGAVVGAASKVFSMVTNLSSTPWNIAKGAFGKIKDIATVQRMDVYVKGKEEPVLLAFLFQNGSYYSQATGRPLHSIKDIDSNVVDKEGNVVVTLKELSSGMYDRFGNRIDRGIITRIAALSGKSIVGMSKLAFKGGKAIFNLAVKGSKKLGSFLGKGFKSIWGGITAFIRDPVSGFVASTAMVRETNQILSSIYQLLDSRLPGGKKKLGDIDGDGIVENSLADIRRKKKEEDEKNEAKKAKDLEEKRMSKFGIGSIIGGVGGLLGKLFGKKDKEKEAKDKEGSSGGIIDSVIDFLMLKELMKGRKGAKGKPGLIRRGIGAIAGGIGKGVKGGAKLAGKGGLAALGGAAKIGGKLGLAGKLLGGAGVALSGISLANNLAEGNYKAALLDGGMLAASGAMTMGGFGSAAAVGTFLVSNPIGWAILGTAAVGAAAYGIKQWWKRNKVNDFGKARILMYGFDPDKNKEVGPKILEFERLIEDCLVEYNGQFVVNESKMKKKAKQIADIFDIPFEKAAKGDENAKKELDERAAKFHDWYTNRFRPIFLRVKDVLKALNPKYKIGNAYDLKGTKAYDYFNNLKPKEDNKLPMTKSPFKDVEVTVTIAEANKFVDKQIAKYSKEKDKEIAKNKDRKSFKDSVKGALKTASLGPLGLLLKLKDKNKEKDTKKDTKKKGLLAKLWKASPIGLLASIPLAQMGLLKKFTSVFIGGNKNVTEFAKDGKIHPFNAIRYKAYGLTELTREKISTILNLERITLPKLKISGNVAVFDGDLTKLMEEAVNYFNIEKEDEKGMEVLGNYLQYRFLPVFTSFITSLKTNNVNTKLKTVDRVKASILIGIQDDFNKAEFIIKGKSKSIWDWNTSPWNDGKLNTSKNSIKADIEELKELVEKEKSSQAKTQAESSAKTSKIDKVKKALKFASPFAAAKTAMEKTKEVASKVRNAVIGPRGEINKDLMQGGIESGLSSSTIPGNLLEHAAKAATAIGPGTKAMAVAVYNAFRKAGFSDKQSRVLTAEVGRENSLNPKYIFGYHKDPHSGHNGGMISWQKDRLTRLLGRLVPKGLVQNGKFVQSQENLNEQAAFLKEEMETSYSKSMKPFLDNPDIDYQKGMDLVGKHFIKWRIDDPKYRAGGLKNRQTFLNVINNALGQATAEKVENNANSATPEQVGPSLAQQANTPTTGTTSSNTGNKISDLINISTDKTKGTTNVTINSLDKNKKEISTTYSVPDRNANTNVASKPISNSVQSFLDNISEDLVKLGQKFIKLKDKSVMLRGMDPNFMKLFYAMVGEYVQSGGKVLPVQINSAFRTRAEQERLYCSMPKGKAAKPGCSAHESGRAIDVNTVNTNELIKTNIAQKYGFYRAVRNETWHLENKYVPRKGKSTEYQLLAEQNDKSGDKLRADLQKKHAGQTVQTMDDSIGNSIGGNTIAKVDQNDLYNKTFGNAISNVKTTVDTNTPGFSTDKIGSIGNTIGSVLSSGKGVSDILSSTMSIREDEMNKAKQESSNRLNEALKQTQVMLNNPNTKLQTQVATDKSTLEKDLLNINQQHYQEALKQTTILNDILDAINSINVESSPVENDISNNRMRTTPVSAKMSPNPVKLNKSRA